MEPYPSHGTCVAKRMGFGPTSGGCVGKSVGVGPVGGVAVPGSIVGVSCPVVGVAVTPSVAPGLVASGLPGSGEGDVSGVPLQPNSARLRSIGNDNPSVAVEGAVSGSLEPEGLGRPPACDIRSSLCASASAPHAITVGRRRGLVPLSRALVILRSLLLPCLKLRAF